MLLPAVFHIVDFGWGSGKPVDFVAQFDWKGLELKDVFVYEAISLIVKHDIHKIQGKCGGFLTRVSRRHGTLHYGFYPLVR